MQTRNPSNLKGIDISHHQNDAGSIDFAAVKASGISVVYIKATEGATYTDPKLRDNAVAAKAAGLYVGVYHFVNPDRDAESQAQYFVTAVKDLPLDCALGIDFETRANKSRDDMTALAKSLLDRTHELAGKDVVLYTYTNFARDYFTAALKDYRLWVAHYTTDAAPGDNGVWDTWAGFQYSSTGTVSGIKSNVDLDEFTADILLSSAAPAAPAREIIWLTVPSGTWNVRKGPGTQYPIVTAVGAGVRLQVFADAHDGWYELTNGERISVDAFKGSTTPQTPLAPPASPALSATAYTIKAALPGYATAADALAGRNARGTVMPGSYSVYNRSAEAVNVTAKAGVPGSWIDTRKNK